MKCLRPAHRLKLKLPWELESVLARSQEPAAVLWLLTSLPAVLEPAAVLKQLGSSDNLPALLKPATVLKQLGSSDKLASSS